MHKIRLVRDSLKNSLSINQLWEKYYIGYTSARSIINEVMNAQEYAQAMEKRMGRQRLNQTYIRKTILNWISSHQDGITIKKLRNYLVEKLGIDIPWYQIRRYFKTVMKLSYKKGCKRRIDIDQNRLSYVRLLYSIRMAKHINEDILMVNIDKTSLNREVLNQRSWLKVGANCELFNQKFKDSLSLVSATTSNGDIIAAPINHKLNSVTFIEFLKTINCWIDEVLEERHLKIFILLDNCSIHRSKLVLDYMKTTDRVYLFLPQYTPTLTPIELLFGKLKKLLSESKVNALTSWKSKNGTRIIGDAIQKISNIEVIREWRHVIQITEKYIDTFRQYLNHCFKI